MDVEERYIVNLDKRDSFSQSVRLNNVAGLHTPPSNGYDSKGSLQSAMVNDIHSMSIISKQSGDASVGNSKEGLQHPRAVVFLILWYMFSAGTLFLNKYILSYQKFNPYLLCKYHLHI